MDRLISEVCAEFGLFVMLLWSRWGSEVACVSLD
jgi:hypothetical protein